MPKFNKFSLLILLQAILDAIQYTWSPKQVAESIRDAASSESPMACFRLLDNLIFCGVRRTMSNGGLTFAELDHFAKLLRAVTPYDLDAWIREKPGRRWLASQMRDPDHVMKAILDSIIPVVMDVASTVDTEK